MAAALQFIRLRCCVFLQVRTNKCRTIFFGPMASGAGGAVTT